MAILQTRDAMEERCLKRSVYTVTLMFVHTTMSEVATESGCRLLVEN
jgi:hypothetical protein